MFQTGMEVMSLPERVDRSGRVMGLVIYELGFKSNWRLII
jgi:hypothetical protein